MVRKEMLMVSLMTDGYPIDSKPKEHHGMPSGKQIIFFIVALAIVGTMAYFAGHGTFAKTTTDASGSDPPQSGNQPVIGAATPTPGQEKTETLVAVPITDPIPIPPINKQTMRGVAIDINDPPKILEVGGPNLIDWQTGQPVVVITNIAFDRYKIAFDVENRASYRNSGEYTFTIREIWIVPNSLRAQVNLGTSWKKFSAPVPPGKKVRVEIKLAVADDARNFIDTAAIKFNGDAYGVYTFS